MIRIDRPTDCCGCEACAQRCPKQCIAMHADAEGFLYPRIDTAACIDCGLCEQVCPVLRPAAPRTPTAVYAAKNPDERIRMESSSGGVFTLLAERTIRAGGVVFGARFDEAWEVVHDSTETIEGLAAFRGSKYVQSRIGTSFARAEEFLKQGRQVLFTGTPCQIAGLNRFLRRSYDNLLTVDVVCHGVPSPLVWRRYLDEIGGGGISRISMRDKSTGWADYSIRIDANERNAICEPAARNVYMRGFLADLSLRPICHVCPPKSGRSGSDLTLGDFWGIADCAPEIADDKGITLLMVNTPRSAPFVEAAPLDLHLRTYAQAIARNPAIRASARRPKKRPLFWKEAGPAGDITAPIERTLDAMRPSRVERVFLSLRYRIGKIMHR